MKKFSQYHFIKNTLTNTEPEIIIYHGYLKDRINAIKGNKTVMLFISIYLDAYLNQSPAHPTSHRFFL